MKVLVLLTALNSLVSAVTWTDQHTRTLDERSIAFSQQLPKSTVIIGRLGRADTRTAVVISTEGHLISPYLGSIDGEPAPYLLYHPDGRREELTTIIEKDKLNFALLKTESPGLAPVPLSERSDDTVFVTGCAPITKLDEQAHFQVCHLLAQPAEDSKVFSLDLQTVGLGDAVFNLDGSLTGIISKYTNSGPQATLLSRIIEKDAKLSEVLPELVKSSPTQLPKAPSLTKDELKELEQSALRLAREKEALKIFPSPLPSVLIFNVDKQLTHSIIGTIVDANGLILTKASELGPDLTARYNGKTHPAVLLSTDEKSDLALVGIEASDMPVIQWHQDIPSSGSPLASPKLLKETSSEMLAEKSALLGNFIGIQKSGTPTIHQTSSVTSLGVVTEQLENGLKISAIRSKSSASRSGLTVGDAIVNIDKTKIPTRSTLANFLNRKAVGDEVQVNISRGGSTQTFAVTLESPDLMPPTTGISANSSIPVIPSVRRSPFPDCLVHTISLNAWDCGSPLYDQNGKAIGLNIASVSAGKTLALTPREIRTALERLLTNSRQF